MLDIPFTFGPQTRFERARPGYRLLVSTLLDSLALADAAGLRYVNDDEPGIRRRRHGRGFTYRLGGRGVTPDDRIKRLAIPPAWTDVWICPDPNGHIQATGRDAQGRKQYRYHAEWERVRDEAKFERMATFGGKLPRIRRTIETDLHHRDLSRRKVIALCAALLDQTLIRVGNDRYARQNGSFGLTTMKVDHAEIAGRMVNLSFTAKGGYEHEVALRDRKLAGLVAQCQELRGQSLFSYRQPDGEVASVRSDDVNTYLREAAGEDVTAKDFRTWGASALLVNNLGAHRPGDNPSGEVLAAIDQVAEVLGNTREVCRSSYLHPLISEVYNEGKLTPAWRASRHSRWMSRAESTLLKLLR